MGNFKEYAKSFQVKSRLGLESVASLCEKLGNPQKNLKFIHVAGTNGKGSVCAFLQCILTQSGKKTGKYISPNMVDVCERISIDGENISQKELDNILEQVGKAAKEIEKEKGVMPTQFEIWTVAAFLYFEKEKCDIVVLETGLGGRLDATNVIDRAEVCIITKIDIDHVDYLGGTIEKIAFEKAGIIKENVPVISAIQKEEALKCLKEKAKEKNSQFILAEKPKKSFHEEMSEIFDYKEFRKLRINLAGIHQTENASLAVEAALLLQIDENCIRSGLLKARNIGRFEKISDNPTIIFDGAHNLSGTAALIDSVKRYFPDKNISIIYGAMADKDIEASILLFKESGFCEKAKIFTVKVKDNPRSENEKILAEKFINMGFSAESCENIYIACKKACLENELVLICGSLYLYKDFSQIKLIK